MIFKGSVKSMLIFVQFAFAFLLIQVKNRASLKIKLMNCQIKILKLLKNLKLIKNLLMMKFNCYTIEDKMYDIRFKIQLSIVFTSTYKRGIKFGYSVRPSVCLSGA